MLYILTAFIYVFQQLTDAAKPKIIFVDFKLGILPPAPIDIISQLKEMATAIFSSVDENE